jgi:uncharacterized membrane-anchored protein YitT (DUF2179 family)
MKEFAAVILLCLGVVLVSYAQGTPGDQVLQSVFGGLCLGLFVAMVFDTGR